MVSGACHVVGCAINLCRWHCHAPCVWTGANNKSTMLLKLRLFSLVTGVHDGSLARTDNMSMFARTAVQAPCTAAGLSAAAAAWHQRAVPHRLTPFLLHVTCRCRVWGLL